MARNDPLSNADLESQYLAQFNLGAVYDRTQSSDPTNWPGTALTPGYGFNLLEYGGNFNGIWFQTAAQGAQCLAWTGSTSRILIVGPGGALAVASLGPTQAGYPMPSAR